MSVGVAILIFGVGVIVGAVGIILIALHCADQTK